MTLAARVDRDTAGTLRRLPFAGVELGGTKCICTLAHGPDEILAQEVVATTVPDGTLPAIDAVLADWWAGSGFGGLGIASFGPIDTDPMSREFGHVLFTNKPGWRGADIGRRLASPFPVPCGFDTDVNGAALAERHWGAARDVDDFAYVTVGTGIGVGLLVGGRPTRGFQHGEIGHLRVPRLAGDMVPSACRFHDDCVEGLASGSAIALALGDLPIEAVGPDHPVWDRVLAALAAMCHALVCTTAPRRIAFGGGVISRQPHLLDRLEPMLRDSLNGYVELPDDGPYIIAPELAEQAGPLGPIAIAREAAELHAAE